MNHEKKTKPSIRPPGISEAGLGSPQAPLDSSVLPVPAGADRRETAPAPIDPGTAVLLAALQEAGIATAGDVAGIARELRELGLTLRGMRDQVHEYLNERIRRLEMEVAQLRAQNQKITAERNRLARERQTLKRRKE